MRYKGFHLSYCTNIHPGESWKQVDASLRQYVPSVKKEVSDEAPFGIGLRLSARAARELREGNNLQEFKAWLDQSHCYVYTMNGFPYGGFHHQRVKDDVHTPDWTTPERLQYTVDLCHLLTALLPEGVEGGISTSPLSYKLWHTTEASRKEVMQKATLHIAKAVAEMAALHKQSGKLIHLDLEPEPDGLIENSTEMISWFTGVLLPQGGKYLADSLQISTDEAETLIRRHLQVCYDVCHFALAYEEPKRVLQKFKEAGIQVGKVQISAALKVRLPADTEERNGIQEQLAQFVESTYLHQVIAQNSEGELIQYPDLMEALDHLFEPSHKEWRIHFHVPVFTTAFHHVQSTQSDILEVLSILKNEPFTRHLEVETYTWGVLPPRLKKGLASSITRELQWVKENMV
jgi:hypothetical protein